MRDRETLFAIEQAIYVYDVSLLLMISLHSFHSIAFERLKFMGRLMGSNTLWEDGWGCWWVAAAAAIAVSWDGNEEEEEEDAGWIEENLEAASLSYGNAL